jgi:hypothetical protein
MRAWSAAVVVMAIVLAVAVTARAGPQQLTTQAQPPARSQTQPELKAQPQPKIQPASPDAVVEAMGVSLDRIRRQLRESPPTLGPWLIRLDYHVEVVAKAPPIELLKGFNIGASSAVQYGGMTHSEFLRITAPPWRPW